MEKRDLHLIAAQLDSSIATTGNLVGLLYITKITHPKFCDPRATDTGENDYLTARPSVVWIGMFVRITIWWICPPTSLSHRAVEPSRLRIIRVSLVRAKLVRSGISCKPLNVVCLGIQYHRRIRISDGKPQIVYVESTR
jgi:hypothetical protein